MTPKQINFTLKGEIYYRNYIKIPKCSLDLLHLITTIESFRVWTQWVTTSLMYLCTKNKSLRGSLCEAHLFISFINLTVFVYDADRLFWGSRSFMCTLYAIYCPSSDFRGLNFEFATMQQYCEAYSILYVNWQFVYYVFIDVFFIIGYKQFIVRSLILTNSHLVAIEGG